MSDSRLRVIPTDPSFVPTRAVAETLLRAVQRLVPEALDVVIISGDQVEFIDAGNNFESVHCPGCGSKLDMNWWADQMSSAWSTQFEDLSALLPCCGLASSLNDLRYDWPQGFARWRIEVRDPQRGPFGEAELQELRQALAHDLLVIWTHF